MNHLTALEAIEQIDRKIRNLDVELASLERTKIAIMDACGVQNLVNAMRSNRHGKEKIGQSRRS